MGTVYAKDKPSRPFFDIGAESEFSTVEQKNIKEPPPSTKPKLRGVKARVEKVNIDGLGRTKDDIIKETVDHLFMAQNFEEVIVRADKVKSKLDSLGCFKNIGVFIDVAKGPNASADGLEVTFQVKELSRLIGGVNTMVGNNEGSLVVGVKLPNVAGRGERVQCEYMIGNRKSSNFSLTFIKPYVNKKFEPVFSASIIQQAGEFPWSGYRQLDKGLLLDVGFKTSNKTRHNFCWEGLFRETSLMSRTASFTVRESSGPTMKSALRHIVTIDTRDDRIYPSIGNLVQFTSEVSGLGGSMAFLKNDLYLQTNLKLTDEIVLQGSLQMGLLNDFYGTNLTEHFYVGGPQSIRGFQERGVGPQCDGNAIGSNCQYSDSGVKGVKFYWASGLHAYTPLPFRPGKGGFGDLFRAHFFVNAGNIGPINRAQNVETNMDSVVKNIRLSSGLGLALRIGDLARFELNYCFPFWYKPGDVIAPGIQFGLGVNFL